MGRFSVLITGASGGIGAALCKQFLDKGYNVIGTGSRVRESSDPSYSYIRADLQELTLDPLALKNFSEQVRAACIGAPLKVLINNAAAQILGDTKAITSAIMQASFAVNVNAPFILTQTFLRELEDNKGCVLNIGSVHAQATKAGFIAYTTTKTALHGLTRALAVDLGGRVRVNTLAPAATATPMLLAGFEGKEEAFAELASMHPLGRIAEPSEVSEAAFFLCSDQAKFITGSTFYVDCGILSRLHDPA